VFRRSMKNTCDILIVGAGPTGASIAYALSKDPTIDVMVVDKARGPGGRCSRRRATVNNNEVAWNHGCEHFDRELPISINTDGIHGTIREMLLGIPTVWSCQVRDLTVSPTGVSVFSQSGQEIVASRVIATMPVPQMLSIPGIAELADAPTGSALRAVSYTSQHAVLCILSHLPERTPDIFEVRSHGTLAQGGLVCTVLTTPEWSETHVELDAVDVGSYWRRNFESLGIRVDYIDVHRWRYAQPRQFFPMPLTRLANGKVILTGDAWLGNPWEEVSLQSFLKNES